MHAPRATSIQLRLRVTIVEGVRNCKAWRDLKRRHVWGCKAPCAEVQHWVCFCRIVESTFLCVDTFTTVPELGPNRRHCSSVHTSADAQKHKRQVGLAWETSEAGEGKGRCSTSTEAGAEAERGWVLGLTGTNQPCWIGNRARARALVCACVQHLQGAAGHPIPPASSGITST